ncbi:trimeric intracellular cation channel family protein [Chelatococcus sp. SYSU_G07232]|uniref:Trimeric intracellular cation channel family protein n=1 Tax=Chelatococcus albus TaxID=3047466 RepID=A0ABT7AJE6_9HYPH|nr:trimeric intracellular cation channel family protein [Chelatococcus sp. SYSU_G07232]MDJ1159494.1 trimeric intracellular cation channel family protein [Chelatococcus sp. SYSU_G07232]
MLGVAAPWLEWAGVAVFALTGALVAARKGMDPIGFMLLATVTGVGGGTLRDLLIGVRPVFWISDPTDVLVCMAVAVLVFAGGGRFPVRAGGGRRRRLILWADAAGLALFSVTGAERAIAFGASPLVAVALGTMTATFGGIIRDILANEVPLVLAREIYITAAVVGATAYVVALHLALPPLAAELAGVASGFGLRGLALARGWSMPNFQPPADGA